MGHLTSKLDWGDIDLNTETGQVFFQQKWFYNWITVAGVTPWTRAEKLHFHNTLDQQIWKIWSNKVKIRVTGGCALAKRFPHGLPINFDVRWVLKPGHWTVNARKLLPGGQYRSNVVYGARTINLDSEDLKAHSVQNSAGVKRNNFLTVPHEFGHTVDTDVNPDEYNAGSPNFGDTISIMNIGNEVRSRHIAQILTELGKLVPGCNFQFI